MNRPRWGQTIEQCTLYFRPNTYSLGASQGRGILDQNPRNECSKSYLGPIVVVKSAHRPLRRVHSHATFSRAFHWYIIHQNPTKIDRSSYLEGQVRPISLPLSRDANDASKNEILAIFNLGRCSMAQNDPTNNLE